MTLSGNRRGQREASSAIQSQHQKPVLPNHRDFEAGEAEVALNETMTPHSGLAQETPPKQLQGTNGSRAQLRESKGENYSPETEQMLLSLAMKSPFDVFDLIKPEYFFLKDNAMIAKAIVRLADKGHATDPVTIHNSIQIHDGADVFNYLAEIHAINPPIESLDTYINILHEHAYSRQALLVADQIRKISHQALTAEEKSGLFDGVLQDLESYIEKPMAAKSLGDSALAMGEIARRNLDEDQSGLIMTGFTEVDQIINGILPGDLIIVAGRPAMGKTAFALGIAEGIARNHPGIGSPFIFSMEMSAEQIGGRSACGLAKVDSRKLRRGALSTQEWNRYARAEEELKNLNIMIDDRPGLDVASMRKTIRSHIRRVGAISALVIDYLQLMTESHGNNRNEQLSYITRNLKGLGKEFGFPVIALSQLNRDVEKRVDKRPMTSDLRESGAIEQDADVIMLVYRDEVYNPDTPDQKVAEIIITKNRAGEPGVARLGFEGIYTQFENLNQLHQPSDEWREVTR